MLFNRKFLFLVLLGLYHQRDMEECSMDGGFFGNLFDFNHDGELKALPWLGYGRI